MAGDKSAIKTALDLLIRDIGTVSSRVARIQDELGDVTSAASFVAFRESRPMDLPASLRAYFECLIAADGWTDSERRILRNELNLDLIEEKITERRTRLRDETGDADSTLRRDADLAVGVLADKIASMVTSPCSDPDSDDVEIAEGDGRIVVVTGISGAAIGDAIVAAMDVIGSQTAHVKLDEDFLVAGANVVTKGQLLVDHPQLSFRELIHEFPDALLLKAWPEALKLAMPRVRTEYAAGKTVFVQLHATYLHGESRSILSAVDDVTVGGIICGIIDDAGYTPKIDKHDRRGAMGSDSPGFGRQAVFAKEIAVDIGRIYDGDTMSIGDTLKPFDKKTRFGPGWQVVMVEPNLSDAGVDATKALELLRLARASGAPLPAVS